LFCESYNLTARRGNRAAIDIFHGVRNLQDGV
jgi:hypothetical protein